MTLHECDIIVEILSLSLIGITKDERFKKEHHELQIQAESSGAGEWS